ncbi:MAG: HPr family phosphocarrier protein [Defluviitaleaceae bacterium]|nr:HPr family phosphocarrier protein [Defluviitaleaceae bacterium]
MIERKVQVNSLFEPSEAAMLVQAASKFNSRISLMREEKTANAKSIMGIISLDIQGGQTVKIVADGDDEMSALPIMEKVLSTAKPA